MLVGAGKLAGDGGGTGGRSHKRITGAFPQDIATFDNSYRKCYNKRNDDNKKAISHQSPKFTLYGVFPLSDIKSH